MSYIDLSQAPYYDDFDETKKFARVLFKPGFPVQARELTQLQTIIQKQIERFGRHILKEGSIVYGGQFDIDNQVPYIKIDSTDVGSNVISPGSYKGAILYGRTTGISAFVLDAGTFDDSGTEQNVFFIRYLSGNASTNVFSPGEIIETNTGVPGTDLTAVVKSSSASGFGSLFTIESGVLFTNNFFAPFDKQSVILSPFSQDPSCRVGFLIDFSITTSADDLTLLDNSQGFLNYASPGADRLTVTPTLKTVDVDSIEELPEFVELFTIKDGVIQERYERPIYAIIGDEIAKRTFDESGDYCVRGLGVRIREHLDTGENEGYLTAENGGDANLLAIGVEPGVVYVKGYEINKLVTSYVFANKSATSAFVNNQITSANVGSYISIKEIVGLPQLDTGSTINLYSTAETRITSKRASSASPAGSLLGTARVRAIRYESGELGKPAGQMRLYLYDVRMTSGTFSSVRAVGTTTPVHFFADVVLNLDNTAVISEQNFVPTIYRVGSDFIKTIRSENETSDTTFTFQRTNHNITMSSGGTFTVSVTTSGESFPYGVVTLSSFDKQSLFVSLNGTASTANLAGTVSGTAGSKTITGVGTLFLTRLNIGDRIEISGELLTIASISSNTSLTTVENLVTSRSGVTYKKTYLAGDMISLDSIGSANGQPRTVVGTTPTSLSFNLNETFSTTVNVSVGFLVSRSAATEIQKILRPSRFVKIDCSSVADRSAPINLGISDVYKIRQIKKHSSAFVTDTDGSDVTSQFVFDNGQRDDFYDHAKITAKPGYIPDVSDHLLVELDYFYPDYSQGVGYFSVDSYPIDDSIVSDTTLMTHEIPFYTSSIGAALDLRNYLDFRPIKSNSASDSTTVAGASTNPAVSGAFAYEANGIRQVYPASQVIYDYSYYLARRDVVVIDKSGKFDIIEGRADINPVTPNISENVMGVAKIYVSPYPSISSTYGRILEREDISCSSTKITFDRHTMRDIGVIKDRVNRLEYYSTISLLETQTKELLVLDESGEDRFKNGFFVDGFVDHSLGASWDDDYRCAIDKEEKVLRPFFKMNSFPYQFIQNNSSNVQKTGSLLTLPYTQSVYLEQTKATTYRNIEQSVFRFIGNLEMTPDTDVWADTYTVDKNIDRDYISGDSSISPMEVEWGAWEKYITGYNVYDNVDDNSGILKPSTNHGSYSSWSDALRAGIRLARGVYLIEKEEEETRSGTFLVSTTTTEQQDLGTFVTDVSLVPYIRPQIIRLTARGVKANTRFHIFFDGENMNDYLAPMIIPSNGSEFATQFLAEGSNWVSNEYGELTGILRLPASGMRFRVGTREVMITDSPTNSVDASSYAKNFFVAQGLIQQKQNTVLSTKHTVFEEKTITQSRTLRTISAIDPRGSSCMAYSFFVKAPEGEDGVFLTSVEVFIQALHASLGVWFEIREMNSAGGITRTQVPYSEVWMKRSDPRLKISSNGTLNPTVIDFQCPVFLLNDTQYAFIIHTEGLNPDTYFWISRLGEQDLVTGQQVTARQLTGNVYTTNNNLNWDIVPDIDLKIRFNRAVFNTSVTGIVGMGNAPQEFWMIEDPTSIFVSFGETIVGSDVISLTSISGSDTIEVGDIIVGSNSTKSATVLRIAGNVYYMSDSGFVQNEAITVTGKNSTATISNIANGSAKLSSFDRRTNLMYLSDSNGLFEEGMKITGQSSSVSSVISAIVVNRYSTVNYQPAYILFKNTSCDFSINGFGTASQTMGNYTQLIPRRDFNFAKEQQILSHSREQTINSGNASSLTKAEMRTTSNWVSPIIDLARTHAVFVSNIINDDITGEDGTRGGNLLNKYITRTVTLAEGQDAEDLLVSITAYCPPGITEKFPVKAWFKIRHDEDGDQFSEKPWVEMVNTGEGIYSSVANKYDFRAYTFKVPEEMMIGEYGAVQYSSGGNTFDGYKQFSVKIGLLGVDSAQVPRVSELKAIALQM